MSIYDGEPKIYLSESGSYLNFRAGQPVMDAGVENAIIISLYTSEGWAGNYLFNSEKKRIGSSFEKANLLPITKQYLLDRVDAANKALAWLGNISIDVSNPTGNRIDYLIRVAPTIEILLTKNGINWREQALRPANKK